MNNYKKITMRLLAALLLSAVFTGLFTACGKTENDTEPTKKDTYFFGSYPQTLVSGKLSDTLTALAPNVDEWTSYGYYIDGKPSDFMRYVDVTHDSEKYRGVYFTKYRPYNTDAPYDPETEKYISDYEYKKETIYWFRYDPIEWAVLTETDDCVKLYSKAMLDTREFNVTKEPESGFDASDYRNSSIRKWLNVVFLSTAFSEAERLEIVPMFYDCDTMDCVSLLSTAEVLNEAYGFNPERFEDDPKRAHEATPYARAQSPSPGDFWWLRSQYLEEQSGRFARFVTSKGSFFFNHDTVTMTYCGVVPVVCIKK